MFDHASAVPSHLHFVLAFLHMLIQLEFAYDEGLEIVVSAWLFTSTSVLPGQARICLFIVFVFN